MQREDSYAPSHSADDGDEGDEGSGSRALGDAICSDEELEESEAAVQAAAKAAAGAAAAGGADAGGDVQMTDAAAASPPAPAGGDAAARVSSSGGDGLSLMDLLMAPAEEAALPSEPPPPQLGPVTIPAKDGPPVQLSAEAFSLLMGAYATLRAFSWQLRLSPFTIEVRCAGMHSWVCWSICSRAGVMVPCACSTGAAAGSGQAALSSSRAGCGTAALPSQRTWCSALTPSHPPLTHSPHPRLPMHPTHPPRPSTPPMHPIRSAGPVRRGRARQAQRAAGRAVHLPAAHAGAVRDACHAPPPRAGPGPA